MICEKCGAWVQPAEKVCGYCGLAPPGLPSPAAAAAGAGSGAVAAPASIAHVPAADLAGPWARFWARWLDVSLALLVLNLAVVFLAPQFSDALNAKLDSRLANQLVAVALLPFAMALDALIYALCGNTPARRLCGLRVADLEGGRVRPLTYLARNLRVYLYGMGLGIGLVALFTCFHNYTQVKTGTPTSWDQRLGTCVLRVRGGTWRTALTATIYLLLTVGAAALSRYLGPLTPENQLQMVVGMLNKDTPRTIDADTRLQRVVLVPPRVVEYDYTLLKVTAGEAERTSFNAHLQEYVRNSLVHEFCTEQQFLSDLGGTLRYRYTDKDDHVLGVIEVSKHDCPGSP